MHGAASRTPKVQLPKLHAIPNVMHSKDQKHRGERDTQDRTGSQVFRNGIHICSGTVGSHEEMNKELCMCCALALSSSWGVLEVIETYEVQGVLSTSYPAQDPCQDPPHPRATAIAPGLVAQAGGTG